MEIPTIRKELSTSFDDVMARIPEALAAEGFGVLTKIDVRETLRQKLGVEFGRYAILGACNPTFAHRALEAEIDVGVLLPCNVAIYERDGHTVVNAIDPMQTIASHSPALAPIAEEVRGRLARALDRLG
jgi:uncharacterized protein (DUF302 family)